MFFFLIILIKAYTLPEDIEKIRQHSESDLVHYIQIAGWFTGINDPTDETNRTYQYPPLYSILLIPALYTDIIVYVLILNVILSCLTFIPLYLISKRYTGFYQSILISFVIVIFNMIFSIKSFGYPMVLSALLFTWLIYFLLDAQQVRKSFWLASLSFSLLIFTKYVFFYLIPFMTIWLLLNKKVDIKVRMKMITKFYIMPAIFFLIWTTRNLLIHGLSLGGAVGGYQSILGQGHGFFEIYPETIISKLTSIITYSEPNAMMTYFLVFIIGLIILKVQQVKLDNFRLLLLFNFIIFFCIPAMTFNRFYLNWRYLSTMTPIYLLFGLTIIINNLQIMRKKNE